MEQQILLYTFLSIISILFTFNFLLQTKRRRYKNLPPSPLSLPLIGHLHLLKLPIHRTLHRLSQKHGPIFSLWFGSQRVVIVSSSSAAQECFTTNDIVLANRPSFILGKHLAYNNTTMTTSQYGDHWRNLRRIGAIEIFSTARLNTFSNIRKDEIKQLLLKLSQNAREDFAPVALTSMFHELTFNTIMKMVAGKRYYGEDVSVEKEEARQFREIMKEAFAQSGAANPADFLPILNWVGSDAYEKRAMKLGKRTNKFFQGLIDEHRSKKGGTTTSTMIDHLLTLQGSQPEYYTDQIIKGIIQIADLTIEKVEDSSRKAKEKTVTRKRKRTAAAKDVMELDERIKTDEAHQCSTFDEAQQQFDKLYSEEFLKLDPDYQIHIYGIDTAITDEMFNQFEKCRGMEQMRYMVLKHM